MAKVQRNLPGIRLEEWSTFAMGDIQENIQHLISLDSNDISTILTLPENVNEIQWKFYQVRQMCLQLNDLFCDLAFECNAQTCPEMKAGKWKYLCAAHSETQACCAIDYMEHALEGTSIILSSDVFYPQTGILSEAADKTLKNAVRRLYRIFSHCWYHHKQIFLEFESKTSLYGRFLEFTTKTYRMIDEELVTIPMPYM
ncbi:hypothetical protein BC833DRAFT_528318 [Globomyces pollinis-pini]|nr:hypothetical protein BC833DRAFT_528318 [Globomyces pollinis-pini]